MMQYEHVVPLIEARKEFCASLVVGAIERSDRHAQLNALLEIHADEAVGQARESDRRVREGTCRPLEGILVGIKDNICMRGKAASAGSRMLTDHIATYDATVVRRLRKAGAVLMARCNMDEFAMGSSGETSAYGPTQHPFLPGRVPGGSSSGSAAAVAAGLLHAALGSDTGGSVRQPAAYTGTVGMKPTWGRVSRSGLIAFASSCDQIGPITSCVRDNARLLGVLAGHDPADATSADLPVPDYLVATERTIDGLRIGIPTEYMAEDVPEEIRMRLRFVADALESKGAEVQEVSLPLTPSVFPAYFVIANAEASSNLARYDGVRLGTASPNPASATDSHSSFPLSMLMQRYAANRGEGFGREVHRRIMLGVTLLAGSEEHDWLGRAQRMRRRVSEEFAGVFSNTDLLLTPVTPGPPFAFGARLDDPLHMYLTDLFNTAANLTGIPAISVPAGNDEAGNPLAVQFMAPAFGEESLYTAAAAVERIMHKLHNPGDENMQKLHNSGENLQNAHTSGRENMQKLHISGASTEESGAEEEREGSADA
ncbi:aspartyl/glutamyl-tRNA amidotransferase subunit A [bacterium]|nr:aspartyl/glutamyl-tRNA amidotransferase subunit A [bacterium]